MAELNNENTTATVPLDKLDTLNGTPAPEKKKRSFLFPIIAILALLVGGYYGWTVYKHGQSHEETDDAQIASNMAPVVSRVSGYIADVKVKDNQFVKKGDTLLVLDNRDQKMALQAAEAALGTARSNVGTARAQTAAASRNIASANAAVATANAQIEAARVNQWRTSQDLKRYANLVKDHSITQQQYETALAAKQSADKQLQVLVDQRNQIAQQPVVATSQTAATSESINVAQAMVQQRQVDVENARLNLSYTVITAPADGYVAKVPVQAGQFVTAGAQLFSLVRGDGKWVVANFKETQVEKMAVGQKATLKIDAFPDRTFTGTLSSFSPGTGSSFSILPADNASGNFVKTVQRLPVRIDFDKLDAATAERLRAGMNVTVEVTLK